MSKRRTAEAAEAIEPVADQTAQTTLPATPAVPEAQGGPSARPPRPVSSWSERYSGPVRYEVLTDSRINKIFIKFKLAEGETTPPPEVLTVMRSNKVNSDGSPTGLRFEDSRFHGKAWSLPNDAEGRALAGIIENELEKVGAKLAPAQEQAM